MDLRGAIEHLGRAAPDHHAARDAGALLELPDVVHQHLGLVHLGAGFFHIGAVDAPHVIAGRTRPPSDGAAPAARARDRAARGQAPRLCARLRRRCLRRCPSRRIRDRPDSASGTKSLMSGVRPSVRLPRRTVASWVSEPIGCARPRFTASTPAIKVVLTAPIPGSRTPSLPSAGAIRTGSFVAKAQTPLRDPHGRTSRAGRP